MNRLFIIGFPAENLNSTCPTWNKKPNNLWFSIQISDLHFDGKSHLAGNTNQTPAYGILSAQAKNLWYRFSGF